MDSEWNRGSRKEETFFVFRQLLDTVVLQFLLNENNVSHSVISSKLLPFIFSVLNQLL